jgi:Uma2 family endonuclease
MVAQPSYTQTPTFTVAEYLALEEASDIKHEYVDGYLYAMSGGTLDHDGVANNVRRILGNHLAGRPPGTPCLLRGPDVQLHTSPTLYYYPDALVMCGPRPAGTAIGLHDVTLVVEVLSDATAIRDRGEKFTNYQLLPSFAEYLLVDGRAQAAEHFRRAPDGSWTYRRPARGDIVVLDTIGLTTPLTDFYLFTTL